jgi:hypothetical protein
MCSLKAWFGVSMALVGVLSLWPSYLRVVPGRLDIITASNLRGDMSVNEIPLRSATIVVDFRKNSVCIADVAKTSYIDLAFMRDRRRFAYALFLGASSEATSPHLPDSLVG